MFESQTDIYEAIIKKIKRNRISTTEVADCLGKTGAIEGIAPINRGHFKVGRVFLAYGYNESNWELHEQLQNVKEKDIVLIETHNCNNKAVFGALVSKYLLLYKGASAVVVNGNMRDANVLIKEKMPIWCKGLTPLGCHNDKNEEPMNIEKLNEIKRKYEGAIAVCDDGGTVIIPKEKINEDFLQKLNFIELQEDIWFYCIDTKKWSTYDTVCLKKYLDTNLLPSELKEKFENFVKDK